jgi:hypothetical protein
MPLLCLFDRVWVVYLLTSDLRPPDPAARAVHTAVAPVVVFVVAGWNLEKGAL